MSRDELPYCGECGMSHEGAGPGCDRAESVRAIAALKGYYLIVVAGDVDPELVGPMSEANRDLYAVEHRRDDPEMNDGLFRLDIEAGSISLYPYSGGFFLIPVDGLLHYLEANVDDIADALDEHNDSVRAAIGQLRNAYTAEVER